MTDGVRWLFTFALAAPVTLWISINYSRDHAVYLEIISSLESTDLLFDVFIKFGTFVRLDPEMIYSLYSAVHVALLVFFFVKRRVSVYWIFIYILCFGLLHVVTQIRVGMASVVLAFLLTSPRYSVRLLAPLSVAIHASTVVFVGAGISRRHPALILVTMLGATASVFYFALTSSEKLSLYALDVNETKTISIALISYAVALAAIPFTRIDGPYKAILFSAGIATIAIYFQFLDFKAISNRFIELSHAVSVLILGALDQSRRDDKPPFPMWLKLILLASALSLFYVSNVSNSILNI